MVVLGTRRSDLTALQSAAPVDVLSSEQLLDSTLKSVRAGVRSQLDVLNAEQQLATASRDLIQARYSYLMSRLRLYSLSGEDPLAAVEEINAAFAP